MIPLKRYIAPLLLLLLSVGVYMVHIDATYSSIQLSLLREQELEKYLEDARTAQARLDEIKAKYQNFPPGAAHALTVLLPDHIDPVLLIIEMSTLAESRGLLLKDPQVSANVEGGGGAASYKRHSISFGISAPYPMFRTFLRDMESSLALRDSASIGFTGSAATDSRPSGGNPETMIYDYTINVVTYSLE